MVATYIAIYKWFVALITLVTMVHIKSSATYAIELFTYYTLLVAVPFTYVTYRVIIVTTIKLYFE